MPRDWMDDARGRDVNRDRWEDRRQAGPRDDFGQADFSTDYAYDPARRAAYRADEETARRADDYGQADYSEGYGYDAERGRAFRRHSDEDPEFRRDLPADRSYGQRMDEGDYPRGERSRSFMGRAGAFFSGREEPARRRRGPSDRVLWAIIAERLEGARGLDLRDVEVMVEDGEVTLNGVVRHKAEKRRIEDIADIDGVRHVQNNLRVRESRWF